LIRSSNPIRTWERAGEHIEGRDQRQRENLMRAITLKLLVLMLTVIGCATVQNTPAQDLAWERWKACDHFSTIALDRIDLDGRLVVTGYEHEAAPFTGCVREVAADQVRRGVATAQPPTSVLVKLYGCQGGAM
jgi:hypothetical protein